MPSSFLSAATLALSSRIRSPTSIILLELWCHLSSSTGSSMSGDHQSKIDQCELLATLCALMSFPDLLQGPEILFWTDNIGTLKAVLTDTPNPEMVALADALYLCLARLGARVYFALVPGLANSLPPQPSSVRCSWLDCQA